MCPLSLYPQVRVSYRGHHNGTNNVVRSNDVVFSAHALLLTAVTLVQIAWYWDYPPLREQEKPDRWLRYGVLGSLAALGVFALIFAVVVAAAPGISSWFTYVNVLAEAKVVISLVKYCPQVYVCEKVEERGEGRGGEGGRGKRREGRGDREEGRRERRRACGRSSEGRRDGGINGRRMGDGWEVNTP